MTRLIQRALSGLACLGLSAATASAIGPHEILLLVNRNSPDSIELANHYRHLRSIPDRNVVLLDVPPEVLGPKAELSPEAFTQSIWEPAARIQQERGLNHQIVAWIYSADFPIRITTKPPMSLQGITFVRGRPPEKKDIQEGLLTSPLFAGPSHPNRRGTPTTSISHIRDTPWEERPVPSMMLGYTGARGVEPERVLQLLTASARADGTQPTGSVFFVVNDDVRSACRAWAFPAAARELKRLGIAATVSRDFPARQTNVIGIQTGDISPRLFRGNQFAPGAMAEHLTSFAARFHVNRQAKCTQWQLAGATATCGAVTEPYALWAKFPHPRFFAHYVRGATCLDSFYLSVKSPVQLLMVGDPLACPWGPTATISVVEDESQPGSFSATVIPGATYTFLVDDGLQAEKLEEPKYTVASTALADGAHTLRVVATLPGPLAHRVFAETTFSISNLDRRMTLPETGAWPEDRPLRLQPSGSIPPTAVSLMKGEQEIARADYEKDVSFIVSPSALGRGPSSVHAVAHYSDGMKVRSPAVRIDIVPASDPPPVPILRRVEERDGVYRLEPHVVPDVTSTWHQVVGPGSTEADFDPSKGTVELGDTELVFRPGEQFAVCPFPVHHVRGSIQSVSADLVVAPDGIGLQDQTAGLVFNYRNPKEFDFFALMAQQGEWVLGEFRKGKPNRILQRGSAQPLGKWFRMEIRATDDDHLEAIINGRIIFSTTRFQLGSDPVGLITGSRPVRYRNIWVSPPFSEGLSVEEDALIVEVSGPVVVAEAARRSLRSSRRITLTQKETRGLVTAP